MQSILAHSQRRVRIITDSEDTLCQSVVFEKDRRKKALQGMEKPHIETPDPAHPGNACPATIHDKLPWGVMVEIFKRHVFREFTFSIGLKVE